MQQMIASFFEKRMLRRFLVRIPIFGPIFHFNWPQHRQAIFRISFLWVFSFLPIIFAAGMSNNPIGNENLFIHLFDAVGREFKQQSQFVYAATFIPPFLYIIIEQLRESEGDLKTKLTTSYRSVFKGYKLIWTLALIGLFVMAVTFGNNQNIETRASNTIFYLLITKYSIYLYLASLYIWYLSILEATLTADRSFVDESRHKERETIDALQQRIDQRSGQQ